MTEVVYNGMIKGLGASEMANLKNLQGRRFDPVRFEEAVKKARREFAARTGEPLLPEASDDLPELPEVPKHDDGVVAEADPQLALERAHTNGGVGK